MKKAITLFLALLLLIPAASGLATTDTDLTTATDLGPEEPTFLMLAYDITTYTFTGYSDSDYLFHWSATGLNDLDARLVYCRSGSALFLTHGGDSTILFHYTGEPGQWTLTDAVFTAHVRDGEQDAYLNALAMLASALRVFSLLDFENPQLDTFMSQFTQSNRFTMNGVTVSSGAAQVADGMEITVVFEGLTRNP